MCMWVNTHSHPYNNTVEGLVVTNASSAEERRVSCDCIVKLTVPVEMYRLVCVAAAALACFSTANAFGLGAGAATSCRVSHASKVGVYWVSRGEEKRKVHVSHHPRARWCATRSQGLIA